METKGTDEMEWLRIPASNGSQDGWDHTVNVKSEEAEKRR